MSTPPLIFGPTPPYSNPPIEPQNFLPSQYIITAVTLGQMTIVTTAVNNNYVIGQICRLIIPNGYGCTQLNELTGIAINIPAPNQVTLNICSSNGNPFISSGSRQQPQIMAIGDVNTGQINSNGSNMEGTFIPGSFINIS